MATKKTESSKNTKSKAAKKPAAKKAPPKAKAAPKAERAPKAEAKPRHPKARVAAAHESKAKLAKSLAPALARKDEDDGKIADRLATASNQQLLRLHDVVETVKEKYGDRAKLIAKIGELEKKSSDNDYLAMLDKLGLPQLLELAASGEKRARA
ncbi:MAG TPA: hypothetical protein VGL61_14555 [Kofleriaceae bacterium]|jgi:hypothetical protein|nr:hypothetical protein [Polyangiales bacterium]